MAKRSQLEKLRELERQLDAELRRLRSTIRAAERGENKRIKDTTKYIARQSRAMQKVVREQERAQEQELARLEKFLGESFETLAEARKSFAKDIRKATKKEIQQEVSRLRTKKNASRSDKQKQRIEREIERLQGKPSKRKKLDPSKPSYSVRQLSDLENQRVISFLTDQKSFDDAGQGYLQPGEYLSVRVPYKYHGANGEELTGYAVGLPRNIVGNWTDLRKYILSYAGMNPAEVSDSVEEWMGRIEVVKFASKFDQKLERAKFIDLKAKRNQEAREYFKRRDKQRMKEKIEKIKDRYQKKLNEQYRKMAPFAFDNWRRENEKAMRDEIRHIKQS